MVGILMCLLVPHFAILFRKCGVSSPLWLMANISYTVLVGGLVVCSVLDGTLKCSPLPQVAGFAAKRISSVIWYS